MKAVFTGFNENYWHLWGMSWLTSLQKIAQYKGDIFVVGFNLTEITQQKLVNAGVNLINSTADSNYRQNTLLEINRFAKNKDGVFVYWDADAYFQEPIDSIFDLAKETLVITTNSNLGFIAGPANQWQIFEKMNSLMASFNDERNLFTSVLVYFDGLFNRIDDTWNFTNIGNLKDLNGKLIYKDKVQKVIHLSGFIKDCLNNKNILFQERYKEYNSLFKKRTLKFISALQHNQDIQVEESGIEPVS